jgi:hypothetical protein
MLAAKEDLVNQVIEVASRRGLTLFGVANEALEQIVKLDKSELRLTDAVREYEVLKAARDAGFVLVPEGLLYDAMDKAHREGKTWMMKKWVESGEWCGKYYSVKDSADRLQRLEGDLRGFFWNAKDFELSQKGENEVLVRCASSRFPESYTAFLGAFIEGMLNALGYQCVQRDLAKGFLELKFEVVKGGSNTNGSQIRER